MKVAVITGIFGAYDPLRPLPENHGFDEAICVTDDPNLQGNGWQLVLETNTNAARLAGKVPKMLQWLYTDLSASVWIDGSVQIFDHRFADFVKQHLEKNDFVIWDHPENRDCLYQEAAYCQDWEKYRANPIREQVAYYRNQGMPEHFGLWAAGCVGMNHTNPVKDFTAQWFNECVDWSIQDQISLPYLLWKTKLPFGTWQAPELTNDLIRFYGHNRND